MDSWKIGFIISLVGMTALFVSAEFSLLKMRPSRLEQLIAEGNRQARLVRHMTRHLDEYLSACQLGITMCSLCIGWIGNEAVGHLFRRLLNMAHLSLATQLSASIAIAFVTMTFFQVLLGEIVPKFIALQRAEWLAFTLATPLFTFHKITFPMIWLTNTAARNVVRLFNVPFTAPHQAHSEEEIQLLFAKQRSAGSRYAKQIFAFDQRMAKEIMVPRLAVVAIPLKTPMRKALKRMMAEQYTRYPVMTEDKDHIIGMVNLKEILTDRLLLQRQSALDRYLRPVLSVLETMPIDELLVKMQRERVQMAILVDEYGGTAGIVTIEDILEEIVGEIQDEFDSDEALDISVAADGSVRVSGTVLLSVVNERFGIELEADEIETLGGWILTQKFDVQQGDVIPYERYVFTVTNMYGRQVLTVHIAERRREQSLRQLTK